MGTPSRSLLGLETAAVMSARSPCPGMTGEGNHSLCICHGCCRAPANEIQSNIQQLCTQVRGRSPKQIPEHSNSLSPGPSSSDTKKINIPCFVASSVWIHKVEIKIPYTWSFHNDYFHTENAYNWPVRKHRHGPWNLRHPTPGHPTPRWLGEKFAIWWTIRPDVLPTHYLDFI